MKIYNTIRMENLVVNSLPLHTAQVVTSGNVLDHSSLLTSQFIHFLIHNYNALSVKPEDIFIIHMLTARLGDSIVVVH